MPRLTLRTLLAYIDDTLDPAETRSLGKKVAASDEAKTLVERIKKVTRRRGLVTPVSAEPGDETADPNTVAEYLDNALDSATLKHVEETCLESDVHLAEVASCHQILTLVLTKPVRVPPRAHRRMYQLVPPPASVLDRQPSTTLPIGGGAPPVSDSAERDDADAALLLGLGRYSAATTWAARFALIGAAAVLVVVLIGAAALSLQHHKQKAPEMAAGHSSAVSAPAVAPVPTAPTPRAIDGGGEPKVPAPPPVEDAGDPIPPPHLAKSTGGAADPGPGLGDPVPPPNTDRPREIAQIKTTRALVVTQPPAGAGPWVRLRLKLDDDEPVMSNWAVMALPGYKADISVDKKVTVRLWGNVPEQLPYRVLESRVKFHIPPPGFDADATLLAGRIYLKSQKPGGAKVRLRVGPEVWDVTLPDLDTDVLAELISWFEPGTVYARAGGSKPRLEGRVAVVFGTAAFTAPARFKKIDKLPHATQVTWDSVTNALSDPKLIPPELREQLLFRDLSDPTKGDLLQQVTRLLSGAAEKVATRESLPSVIKELVGPELPDVPPMDRGLVSRLAVYAQAALADSTADGAASLKPLIDVLRSELPWLARQAVVTALVNWLARDVGNTARLYPVLVEKGLSEKDADWLLTLLRGYISPIKPDKNRLDELVEPVPPRDRSLLGDPEVALREAALWNLMVAELESWVPLPFGVNVGAVGAKVDTDEYTKFLKNMKGKVDALKKREPPAPQKKP
jgi:hypothetical protein